MRAVPNPKGSKSESVAGHKVRKPKWPERLFLLMALGLLAVGTVIYLTRQRRPTPYDELITHQILPELEPVDRLQTDPGVLEGFNVVFLTTDTTRADHIGAYGNRGVESPIIDGLAREGILYSNAVTPSPSTLPAHASLLTGLYPVHHGARANGTFRLEDKVTTLAERLQSSGYRTGAVISAFVLDSRFGLDQGFDLYHDDLTKGMKYSRHMFRERAAELTNEPAVEWLRENAAEPFFLWVHYFDPHAVYLPPEPFRSKYAQNPYNGEIAYADSQIGVLLNELDRLGVRDNTLIVYTSDHGEGLGEHGEQTHSLLVYDSTLRVPLILHAPAKLPQGKVIEHQTCLVDVVPTVLHLLGEDVPGDLDGINLFAQSIQQSRSVLIETISTMTLHGWAPLVGVRHDDYKYILAPTAELYDLSNDPKEMDNLHDRRPELIQQLSRRLVDWLGEDPFLAARQAVDLSNMSLDEETARNLNALGYVATRSGDADPSARLADPKDMIAQWETVQKAIERRAAGDPKGAIALLEACLDEVPGDVFARSILASIYHQLGEYDRAMRHYQRVQEEDPNSEIGLLNMAGVLMAQRKFDEAERRIAEALELEPENAHAYISRGQIAAMHGKENEALELFQRAIRVDPGSAGPGAYNQIGFLHTRYGRFDQAREAFENTLRIDALNGAAHDGLAQILKEEGRIEEAIAELALALRFDPNHPGALSTLGSLISEKGELDRGLALCKKALEQAPKSSPVHNSIGLVYRRRGELELAGRHYRKAIELTPRFEAARVNLAQLYLRQGRTQEAIEQFRAALEANPQFPNPIALCNLGVYHFNRGEHMKALQFYRLALRRDPEYALVHRYLASLYALPDWDRPDLAAFHLRRTLEIDPRQPEAAELREILGRAEQEAEHRKRQAASRPESEPAEGTGGNSSEPPREPSLSSEPRSDSSFP